MPIVKLFALERAKQSPLNPDKGDAKNIYDHEGAVFKVYFYDHLFADQRKLLYVQNEYSVLKQAGEKGFRHLASL